MKLRKTKIPKNKRNEKYWKARNKTEEQYIKKRLSDDEAFNKVLQQHFDKAQDEIQKEIDLQLYKLSTKNEIDITKVRGVVDNADIAEMERYAKRIVAKANQMRRELGRNLSEQDFSKEVNDRMRLYNATMRINRLELVKSKIGMQTVELGLEINNEIKQKLNNDYQEQIKRQAGIMADDLPNLTNEDLKNAVKTVTATTGGVSFSKRVWSDMDGLKAELDVQLINSFVQGASVQAIAKKLRPYVSDKFKNKRYASERIARTESARVDTQATINSLERYGYEYCKWHAEPKACDICQEIAQANPTGYGRGIYEVDKVPFLPAHPNCRCGIGAYWVEKVTEYPLNI